MKNRLQKGFTLIELLIVIALLGALAVGLIGALDPFEQLKKGTDNLIAAGELKSTFNEINANNLAHVFTTGSIEYNTVVVCYKPTSKSFQADPNTKYLADGNPGTGCKSDTPTPGLNDCYWCVQ